MVMVTGDNADDDDCLSHHKFTVTVRLIFCTLSILRLLKILYD